MPLKNVAILISGRGSNMVALLDAMDGGDFPARCVLVVSNLAEARGLAVAAARGIPTAVLSHKDYPSREEHDGAILMRLLEHQVDLVCLAGYMRVLSPVLIHAFRNRILNIHPALLPAFPGLHVQKAALDHGVRFSGCTVHLVDEKVDHGPILLQAVVPILPGDDEASLSNRILAYEHRLYPAALRLICEDKCLVEGRTVRLLLAADEYRTLLRDLVDTGSGR
ncbi:MAG: phosphoribosylglycinamide formyltransferase [Acidobacteriota bacterium]